jgi:hypothetical protein
MAVYQEVFAVKQMFARAGNRADIGNISSLASLGYPERGEPPAGARGESGSP